ncbi:hypothetical protein D3C85_1675910 [compost metagenome]
MLDSVHAGLDCFPELFDVEFQQHFIARLGGDVGVEQGPRIVESHNLRQPVFKRNSKLVFQFDGRQRGCTRLKSPKQRTGSLEHVECLSPVCATKRRALSEET